MWNKLFNVNNPFWQSMGTIFDLFILNLLWLVCCIPLVTIGPATTAMFYALIQRARGEDLSVQKDFFTSFKRNLKQGILLGVPLTLTGAFLAFDVVLCKRSGTGIYTFFMVFFAILFVFWLCTTLYVFPILAKFERTNSQILVWAFTLALKNLSMTAMMVFVIVASVWICHILPGLIFIMPGLAAQFCATVIASIFKPYLPKPFWMEDDIASGTGHESKGGMETGAFTDQMTGQSGQAGSTYADFDEAAFYGYDAEEVEKLLKESETDEQTN